MTVQGFACFTDFSKAGRYISRRVRSSTWLELVIRRCSWEFAAKCFRLVPTFLLCTPLI